MISGAGPLKSQMYKFCHGPEMNCLCYELQGSSYISLEELSAIRNQSAAGVINRLKKTYQELLGELRKLASLLQQKLAASQQAAVCRAEHEASKCNPVTAYHIHRASIPLASSVTVYHIHRASIACFFNEGIHMRRASMAVILFSLWPACKI